MSAPVWHPYPVEFESPEGRFALTLHAISWEHAHLQLASLKENGRVVGDAIALTIEVQA